MLKAAAAGLKRDQDLSINMQGANNLISPISAVKCGSLHTITRIYAYSEIKEDLYNSIINKET